jgi:hypothetical protein
MTKRYDNLGTARAWLNASPDEEGQSSNGNMSFAGPVLYSYSTPIAHHLANVVLLTSETYSVTTEGKHKNAAWHACRSKGVTMFRVPFLLLDGNYPGRSTANAIARRNGSSPADQHMANLADYDARIKDAEERAARARVHKATGQMMVDYLKQERAAYAYTFGLGA